MNPLLLILCFLSACNFAPKYTRPDSLTTVSWRLTEEEESSSANTAWWEAFGDPVLTTLITRGLLQNKDLQGAISRVEQYYGQFMVARAPLFPEIDLKSNAIRQRFSKESALSIPGSGPVFSDYGATLNLSYEIDFWGKLRNASRAAMEQYLGEIENRRTVVLSLVAAIAESYIYLLQLDLEMKISQATLETRKESLEIALARFEGGLTSEIEVAQAESLLEEALKAVKELERKIPQQENLICALIAEPSHPVERGAQLQDLILSQTVPLGLPSDLLSRRPDILRAENRLIAAHAQIGVAKAAFFPSINLLGFYGTDTQHLKNFFSLPAQSWQFGGSLFDTIFSGGKLLGGLKIAKSQQKEALSYYEQTILTALKEVNDALIGHKKSKEITLVEEADVAALEEYVYLAWLKYDEGQTQYLTVLDAERSLFSEEIHLAEALGKQFFTLIALYKALGGGWVIEADQVALTSSS